MEFSEGTPYMTNKEWLATLDDEVLADLILDGLQKFARCSTSSIHYLTEWLGKEHTKDDYVEKYYIKYYILG